MVARRMRPIPARPPVSLHFPIAALSVKKTTAGSWQQSPTVFPRTYRSKDDTSYANEHAEGINHLCVGLGIAPTVWEGKRRE